VAKILFVLFAVKTASRKSC